MSSAALLDIAEARRLWREYKSIERARFRATSDQVARELYDHENRAFESVPAFYRDGRFLASSCMAARSGAMCAPHGGSEPLYVAGFADGTLDWLGFEV